MFELEVLPPVTQVRELDTSALVDAMGRAARLEAATAARRLAAIAELFDRRLHEVDADQREQWLIDGHEQVTAEVACALGISRARASALIRVAHALYERLPKTAAKFALGLVDYRVITILVARTELILDDADVATLDAVVARQVHRWNRLSRKKLTDAIDTCVLDIDRLAKKPARTPADDREIGIGPDRDGNAEIWGTVAAPDAIAFDTRLNALADSVCPQDPRTKARRRADALGALSVGATTLACHCGRDDCPTLTEPAPPQPEVVITVVSDPAVGTGYLPGYGVLSEQALADIAERATQQLQLAHPGEHSDPEPGYRPSAALAAFVRARDLTCRFPGCDAPAQVCDVDHTVPWPHGPTHPSNLKILCRRHHLLKTFYTGPRWWKDTQRHDGTIVWTSPTGHTYRTKPHGALLFPSLTRSTGHLDLPAAPPPKPGRGHAMPTRTMTRAQQTAYRINYERTQNAQYYALNPEPPPEPPPF
ncbi:hypothetical protein MCHIJ_40840 [Mycolicibacterium chitae]|uniref:13e12 repeat-containing protein n=2 Tax=Mycolicibacterium TaxID=1866885 RepID=A0A448I6W9_MYCCI|nr:HNH endonuclease signature motif containing protein [Mycolicibacterium chitae]BBZ04647.1 hypothetical protein MCHIJ_40840 [Mycolicibacterium chitae]VEG48277.1 13e12 repeat-containing protein [Mycolicibacterium chitae]